MLICGTILDETGEAIDLEPLVWIDPGSGSGPLHLDDCAQRVVRMPDLPLEPFMDAPVLMSRT